ncbi:MAG: hypothetical protein ABR973_00605 [Candidatus Acidiferrales bacterium]
MAKKKATPKKKAAGKKKVTLRSKPARAKKTNRAKKPVRRSRTAGREISSGSERSSLGSGPFEIEARPARRGLGEGAAGQSGDLQGLSRTEDVDSESVAELIEEGQAFEADVVSGVENALDADQGEVRTHGRPEDELPPEER